MQLVRDNQQYFIGKNSVNYEKNILNKSKFDAFY